MLNRQTVLVRLAKRYCIFDRKTRSSAIKEPYPIGHCLWQIIGFHLLFQHANIQHVSAQSIWSHTQSPMRAIIRIGQSGKRPWWGRAWFTLWCSPSARARPSHQPSNSWRTSSQSFWWRAQARLALHRAGIRHARSCKYSSSSKFFGE